MNLEDIRNEIRRSIDNINKECERTANLLEILKRKNTSLSEGVDKLREENYENYLDHIATGRETQYLIQKKIMELNFDLEKFFRDLPSIPSTSKFLIQDASGVNDSITNCKNVDIQTEVAKNDLLDVPAEPKDNNKELILTNSNDNDSFEVADKPIDLHLRVDVEIIKQDLCSKQHDLYSEQQEFDSKQQDFDNKQQECNSKQSEVNSKQQEFSIKHEEFSSKQQEFSKRLEEFSSNKQKDGDKSLESSSKLKESNNKGEVNCNAEVGNVKEEFDDNARSAPSKVEFAPINSKEEAARIAEKENAESSAIIQKIISMNEAKKKSTRVVKLMPDLSFKTIDPDKVPVFRSRKTSTKKPEHVNPAPFELPALKDLPPSDIPAAKTPELNSICAISHAETPSEFYVAVGNDPFKQLTFLNNELFECFSGSLPMFESKQEAQNYVSRYCVAYSHDYSAWYRAAVENFDNDDKDLVSVRFIDYGNEEEVHYSFLRLIDPKFCLLPAFAQKCHLAYLYPVNVKQGVEYNRWSKEVIAKFKAIVQDKLFIMNFVLKELDSFAVDLLALDSQNGESVGLYLMNKKLAVQIVDDPLLPVKNQDMVKQIMRAQGQEGISECMTESEALDIFFKNKQMHESLNINEAVTNYDTKDEQRICRFILANTKCPRRFCQFDHTPLPNGLITSDMEEVIVSAINELTLPIEGEEIELIVTHVINAWQFYANKAPSPEQPKTETLSYLVDLMNHKETVKTFKSVHITPSIGQIALVYFSYMWHRGRIVDYVTTEHDTYNVFLVDGGEEVAAKLADLREIPLDFLELPFQAIKCYLSQVCLNPNASAEDAKSFLESEYLSEKLKTKVVSSNLSSLDVILYDADDNDINEKMVSIGFLIKRDWYIKSKNSCVLVD